MGTEYEFLVFFRIITKIMFCEACSSAEKPGPCPLLIYGA